MTLPMFYAVALLSTLCIDEVLAISPWAISWSSEQFGPDGPWQAVIVGIGSSDSQISLYPGASWTSEILLSTLCDNTTAISSNCYGNQAGLFNTAGSSTYDDSSIYLAPNGEWSNIRYRFTNAVPINAEAQQNPTRIQLAS